jgi:hypothetical protein
MLMMTMTTMMISLITIMHYDKNNVDDADDDKNNDVDKQ